MTPTVPEIRAALETLQPARTGGFRQLNFANGSYETYQAVFVQHAAGEWDRILIARDDGTVARALVMAINARIPADAVLVTPESLVRALETLPVPATYEEWLAAMDRSYAEDAAAIIAAIAAGGEG